jgi:hypothetical protein
LNEFVAVDSVLLFKLIKLLEENLDDGFEIRHLEKMESRNLSHPIDFGENPQEEFRRQILFFFDNNDVVLMATMERIAIQID